MLYVLFAISTLFLGVNVILSDGDYFNPSVIFNLFFWFFEIACIIAKNAYDISFHPITIYVISIGLVSSTFLSALYSNKIQKSKKYVKRIGVSIQYIEVSNITILALMIIQCIAIIAFVKYLKNFSIAYDGVNRSLSRAISLNDAISKFYPKVYEQISVSMPLAYRIGNPINEAGSYLMLYICINNYFLTGKIKPLCIFPVLLNGVIIILNGSRSPLLRIVTATFILFYIIGYKSGKIKYGSINLLSKIAIASIAVVLACMALLLAMGRSNGNISWLKYLFIYFGAPLLNLDTFLSTHPLSCWNNKETIFGAYTFSSLYQYWGRKIGIQVFNYDTMSTFTVSQNGESTGNVYTMYYKLIYDFGILGFIPFVIVMLFYYCKTYSRIMGKSKLNGIDYSLLLYAYLFNDLVMSAFSNRFYETIFNIPFIKFAVFSAILNYIFVKKMNGRKLRVKMPHIILAK